MSNTPGLVPCQCPYCAQYTPDSAPAPDATQEDLLCDPCREPHHKRLAATWRQLMTGHMKAT